MALNVGSRSWRLPSVISLLHQRHHSQSSNQCSHHNRFKRGIDQRQAEPQVVTVTFDDNLVEVIETEVEGSTLYIGSSRNVSYSSSRGCRIDITVAGLNEVELKGSGDVLIDGLDSDLFAYTVAGSGDLVVRGSAREIEIAVKGSGDINARDLIARDAYVRIMGSGDVQVHATESFDGSVYGSGDIRYYGNPAHISTRVAGSGEISKR